MMEKRDIRIATAKEDVALDMTAREPRWSEVVQWLECPCTAIGIGFICFLVMHFSLFLPPFQKVFTFQFQNSATTARLGNEDLKPQTISGETAGQFGDFVGGYFGTIFALVSVILLFLTLSFQRRTSAIEHFESRYFELIKLHRDNVDEIQIGYGERKATGRKVFVLLIREFREIMRLVREVAALHSGTLSLDQLRHVSYYALLIGVGENSSRTLRASLANFDSEFVGEIEAKLNDPVVKQQVRKRRKLPYVPFEGHQSRLGHYYRHLFQAVCYVDQQQATINKYEYVKIMRAQLSTHEQALLLINSLTPLGWAWWDNKSDPRGNLIKKYALVKNLPLEFFEKDSELNLIDLFGRAYFEWND